MESWIRPKNTINKPSGRFKANAACKKHPKHRQSPGVCSICLGEKLSQLNNAPSSRKTKAADSSSSSSSYISTPSSSDGSSCSSPVAADYGRLESELARRSMRVFRNIGGVHNGLKKSRSMAFHLMRGSRRKGDVGDVREKRAGFWSKFLPRKNDDKRLTHSTTVRERAAAAVH